MRKIYLLLLLCNFVSVRYANAGFYPDRTETDRPFFASDVIQPADVTVCNGATTGAIVFTSNFPGTTFSWTNNNTAIGLGASGNGSIAAFTATNTTTSPLVATITVTPSDGVTNGTSVTFTITVNPTPTVNNVANQSVCRNSTTTAVNFTGSVAGTSYSWTNNNTTIGLAASGTGNIGAFTATNTGTAPVVATVTVTPFTGSGGSSGIFAYIPNFNTDNVSVINTATNAVVTTLTVGSNPYGVSVSPDGSRVYVTNSGSNNVSVINTVTNTVVATVAVTSRPYGIAVSPDGSKVYVANYLSNVVSIINTASNTLVTNITVGSGPYGVAVSPDGSTVYVTNTNSNNVSVISTATNTVVTTVTVGSNPRGVIVSPDGSKVYVTNISSNSVSVINSATNAVDATVTVGAFPSGLTVSPNGSRVYVANSGSTNNVSVINTATNAVEATVAVGNSPNGISVSPNGSRVYVANSGSSNSVSVINTATNAVVATVTVGTTPYAFGNFISNSGTTCTGTPVTYTYTVNPTPTAVATPSNQTGCSGTAITTIALSGTVNGTTYNWTRDNTVSVTGIAASGSGSISGTLTNTTAAPVTVTFTITPTANGCPGTPITATIIVEPTPTVDAVANQVVCNGASTTAVNFTSPIAGTIFNWTNNTPSIGLAASGTGNIPSFTPIFSGTAPVTATITVTPSFSGGSSCTSSSQTFTITVNPIPDVNNVASQTVCNNAATTAINFTGTVPGTNYTWTNSNSSIGLPASGSGNIPSFTALNTTGSPVTSSITVTPTFGSADPEILYYKFDGAGNTAPNLASNPPAGTANGTFNGTMSQGGSGTCGGALQNTGGPSSSKYFNTGWAPNLTNSSWTLSFIASGFTSASNNSFVLGCGFDYTPNYMLVTYNSSSNAGFILRGSSSNFLLSTPAAVGPSSKTVTFVYDRTAQQVRSYVDGVLANTLNISIPVDIIAPNFYIGNVAETTGPNTSSIAAGASLDEVRLYNRALSASEIQALVGSCNSGTTCTGSPEIFGITVNPSPVVNPVTSQNVCTGSNTNAINFTGNVAGATYNWTNSNPSIGLAASGTGNIASFVATNTGSTTQTATITVTPIDPNSSCPGTPESFTISVSPVPTGTATPASQTVCSESAISTIAFTGNVPGITFDWTRDNLAAVTGIPGVGNGNISGTLTNTTNAPVTVTFTVTPSLGGCVGTPFTVTVTVNENLPVATATPTSQTICSGSITPIVLSSNYAGATYSWTRNNTAAVTGIAASGTGDITGTLFNTTTTPVTVTFTIIPTFNGCDGAPITATVLVNAVPTIICPANIVANNTTGVCGTTVNYNTTVTGAPAPTLTYTLSGATTGSGNGNGSGSLFNVGTTTVTVTAANICGTASCSFTVTVNDTENPTISCPANIQANTDAGICAGTVATPNPTRADNCAVTELTWTLTGATTGASPATGINNVGTRLFNKGVTTVTYLVKDAAGNSATCSYTVTVRDLENPVITCSPNITVTTPAGSCTAIVNYTITATDNCPGVTTQLVSGPASGSAFPIGTTTVTWRAIDAATNVSTNCSFTVTVLDGQLPVISAQPSTRTVCAGTSTTFSVTAATAPNAGGPIAYQWQQWSGLAWNNIAGATSSTYTISNPTVAMNTNTFRVVLTGLCSVVNSNAATLYVNPLPTISVNAAPYSSIIPGQRTTLTATVNPTGGSFAWWLNNNPLTGGNTSAVVSNITVDEGIGTYYTIYTDPNGCVVKSPDYVISGLPSDNMWVYPNPNRGFFQVRYYNQTNEPATVMVFNAAGQLVYQRALVTRLAYSAIVIDFSGKANAAGIYIVKVVGSNGKELAAKRVVVYQ